MSTLQALQRLADGPFHRLGDALHRRLEPRYRRLRTHGLNEAGASISGQPDSYVGDSAAQCTIGFCYTVQKQRWGEKVIDDVRAAVAACPALEEIIVALPRDVDRESRTCGIDDWLTKAKAAAGSAMLRIVDGKEMAQLLDAEHQDLRHEHLAIPHSRRSYGSLLASAHAATAVVIESLRASGRYDPDRYVTRAADRDLYQLWQQTLRRDGADSRTKPVRLIALVNDSGLGKTSLLCAFAQSLGSVLPVVLAEARDLRFKTDEVLVAHAITALQGVLDPSLRVAEEAAIVSHLAASAPLTFLVDGLDETHTPGDVRAAINQWLHSKMAQHAVLIVTSRREFWRQCADPSWGQWMPKSGDHRAPLTSARRSDLERLDPSAGHRIPGRFTPSELQDAWGRAGRDRTELYALSKDAREELQHAFTLRVYLDLGAQRGDPVPIVSRVQLLELWLHRRLEQEASPADWITHAEFEQALRLLAKKVSHAQGGLLAIDDLSGLPRFDPINPPGRLIQRLVDANILEAVPRANGIRFAFEAVEDFYRADADVDDIRAKPAQCAMDFAHLSFSDAYPRLARVGMRLASESVREAFVEHLHDASPAMASVVVAAAPSAYDATVRERIAMALASEMASPHRVRAAFAITLLGRLKCQEACDALLNCVLAPANPHKYLKNVAAAALVRLGHVPAALFVYQWARLGIAQGNDTYYFPEDVASFRLASPEFKAALADCALARLTAASGDHAHARASYVLACLADDRLVEHLQQRLEANGSLRTYENHALVAAGTDAAGRIFAQSVLSVAQRLAQLPQGKDHNDQRSELLWPIILYAADIRFLATPAFAQHLRPLIEHGNLDASWIAGDFIKRARVMELMYDVAVASIRINNIAEPPIRPERDAVTAELWLSWWRSTSDPNVRKRLLALAPMCPSANIEDVLLDCLEDQKLRGKAAQQLGEYGCSRAAHRLRQLLAMPPGEHSKFGRAPLARALAELRDDAAIPLLQTIATEPHDGFTQGVAVANLGIIGTPAAEQSLQALLTQGCCQDAVITALIACGSPSAISTVLNHARTKPEAARYLCNAMHHLVFMRGHRSGEYYTHIHSSPLVDFIAAADVQQCIADPWGGIHAFQTIDGPEVRLLFKTWLAKRGTSHDPLLRVQDQMRLSGMCVHELTDRGDPAAIPYVMEERSGSDNDSYVMVVADRLGRFPSPVVAAEVARRLRGAESDSEILRMLALLGRFGAPTDAGLAESFLGHENELLRNIACETVLRLTDPLRVPRTWREM